MKSIYFATIFSVSVLSLSASPAAVDELKSYVYPENAPKSPVSMTYLADGKTFVALSEDGTKIIKYDIKSGDELGVVLDVNSARDCKLKSIKAFKFSPDESHILVYEHSTPIYRRSFTASYYI